MIEQKNTRMQLKKAVEKSLDLLGEPSKKSLLLYLEKEFRISFTEQNSPRLEEIESALKFILGQGATLITDELRKNLARPERTTSKKAIATRQGKTVA